MLRFGITLSSSPFAPPNNDLGSLKFFPTFVFNYEHP
jgi:hypothetical protein